MIRLSADSSLSTYYWEFAEVVYNTKEIPISCAVILLLGCVCWNSKHAEQFDCISTSVFIKIQYIDSLVRSLAFSMPMQLLWSCSSACCCSFPGTMTHLPFRVTALITDRSFHLWMSSMALFPVLPSPFWILRLEICGQLWCLLLWQRSGGGSFNPM